MSIEQYLSNASIYDPSYMVVKTGARGIRKAAEGRLHGRLLDIGCGTKRKQLLVGELVEEYIGLDHPGSVHSPANVDLVGTAYEIPEPDEAFDCVLCTAVLEHLEEPELALKEALRVLKPGGYGLYTIPMYWHLHEEPRDFFRYTKYGIAHLVKKAGFELVETVALSGFLMTFASECGYFLQRFKWGPFRWVVNAMVALANVTVPYLDAKLPSPEFSWLHVVVVRKPLGVAGNA